jgi:hypothetical protein
VACMHVIAACMMRLDVQLCAVVCMRGVQGVDGYFRDPETHASPTAATRAKLAELVLCFVHALAEGRYARRVA